MGDASPDGAFDGVELIGVTDGLRFPEGPIAMADGSVLLVEIAAGRLTYVRPDGTTETAAEPGGGPNGAAIGPDGAVYVCNNGAYFDYQVTDGIVVPHAGSAGWQQGSIQRVDLASGAVEPLYTDCDGARLLAPNDIVFDAHGGFWFTDHGVHADGATAASVLYATADGSSIRPAVYGLDATNGVGLSPDGATLYVAETYRGRVFAFDVTGPGELAGRTVDEGRLLHDAGGTAMFDSLAVAADGSICVATLLTGGITVIPADGGTASFLPTGDPLTTNICFGGADGRTAWITSSGLGRLLRCTWPVAGLDLAHRG